jgi:GNAT superfamily N-acetyltransferase
MQLRKRRTPTQHGHADQPVATTSAAMEPVPAMPWGFLVPPVTPLMERLHFHPLTPDRWCDLEALFGKRGACGGCWCMAWRLSRAEFVRQKGQQNHDAFESIVAAGGEPGILAYIDDVPVGWCAVSPRETFLALGRSRILKPVDDAPVWSIGCLFVTRPLRRTGISVRLLEAAVDFVASRGGRLVEGYPVEPREGALPDAFVWTGLHSAFRRAGFREVARRSGSRPIMRRNVR